MRLRRLFRHLLFWGIPIVATLLLIITGFLYWLVATPTGTRWVMSTAAVQFEGESRGVQGSFWHGLSIGHLRLQLPDELTLEVDEAHLAVDWPQLWKSKQLLVKDLSAQRVTVQMDGEPTPDDPDAAPFEMPELPVSVQIDRLALAELSFSQQGEKLPIDLSQLQLEAEVFLNNEGAQLDLRSARVGYEDIWLDADGTAKLTEFAAPWSSMAAIYARASSANNESPLCLDQYLPDHLHVSGHGPELHDSQGPLCAVSLKANWEGSIDEATVTLTGGGQGIDIDAISNLALSQSFPLRDTSVKIALPDSSKVDVDLAWKNDKDNASIDYFSGSIQAQDFNAGAWIPDMDLPAVVTLGGTYSAQLSESATRLDQAEINLTIADTSRWNGQALQGHVLADVGRLKDTEVPVLWQAYSIKNSDIDLQIGSNQLQIKGGFGLAEDTLKLLVNAPDLKSVWPGLEEIGATKLEAQLEGSVFKQQLQAQLLHVLKAEDKNAKFGNGPVDAQLQLHGELDINSDKPSWRGQIDTIAAEHAGLGAVIAQAFPVDVLIPSAEQKLTVDIGAFDIQATFDKKPWLRFHSDLIHVEDEGFSTKGHSYPVSISPTRIAALMQRLGLEEEEKAQRGGIIDNRGSPIAVKDLVLQLEWNIALEEALAGKVRLHRLEGDVLVPAEPSFPLGLEKADMVININPGAGGRSMVEADINLETAKMGYIKAKGSTPIYYNKDSGFELRDADRKELVVDAHMDSLAWTSLILGDEMQVGGELVANMRIHSTPRGGFESAGEITGSHLKIMRLDDGVRLLDGELSASLNNNRFTVDKLYFPAQLRVEPKEWRTATWISENEGAKDGYLAITGFWDLEQNTGDFDVDLYRYPILQRADRYAMVSGELHMKAVLPQINLTGKITADAGWFDLDMLGGVPTIDSDVVVIRSTDSVKEKEEGAAPIDISMSLDVNLGPRFYLTGYGVNSGLIGQMNIQMIEGQITALGAVNTRGGAIEAYGQRLQLRRGTITFQGDIANPLLDIQALRTGLAVDAGVKVGGTARRPKITLISVPEVSELEKLSWLLFGHGPDEGGGDLALLVSVGSSMLSDGEPFYKRFGIDEISMRSGELGGAGSILPATSTASTLETEISDVERRFIQASKTLSSDVTVGLRQALSDTGTVGRATYKLTRRLTAELSVGTVSGLALIYRWFSRD